jgi:hypothetical protein
MNRVNSSWAVPESPVHSCCARIVYAGKVLLQSALTVADQQAGG